MTTLNPSDEKRLPIAAPMPREDPVMMAVFFDVTMVW
jgi:hypothetical protein